jgi:ribosome maturation factor RimP
LIKSFIDLILDREEQDFLEVASVGVFTIKIRQYKKNIGRTLIVKTNTENIEAELVEANDDFVILAWKAEPKIGKGKETVQKR